MAPPTLIALLLVATPTPDAPDAPPTPADVRSAFDKLRTSLSRVASVEYRAKTTLTPKTSAAKPPAVEYALEFRAKGIKFYSNYKMKNGLTGGNLDGTTTFDGQKFQDYNGLSANLVEAKKLLVNQPYGMRQPLNQMFGFAYAPGDQVDYTTLKEPRLWEALAKRSRPVGWEEVGGHRCLVIEVDGNTLGPDGRSKAYLAEDLQFYPVLVEESAGTKRMTSRVVATKVIETESGPAVLAMRIEEEMSNTGPQISKKQQRPSDRASVVVTVAPDSLKVNHDLDDSLLTVPVSQAVTYHDQVNERYFKNGAPVKLRSPRDATASPRRSPRLMALVVVNVAVLAVLVIWRWRRSPRAGAGAADGRS